MTLTIERDVDHNTLTRSELSRRTSLTWTVVGVKGTTEATIMPTRLLHFLRDQANGVADRHGPRVCLRISAATARHHWWADAIRRAGLQAVNSTEEGYVELLSMPGSSFRTMGLSTGTLTDGGAASNGTARANVGAKVTS